MSPCRRLDWQLRARRRRSAPYINRALTPLSQQQLETIRAINKALREDRHIVVWTRERRTGFTVALCEWVAHHAPANAVLSIRTTSDRDAAEIRRLLLAIGGMHKVKTCCSSSRFEHSVSLVTHRITTTLRRNPNMTGPHDHLEQSMRFEKVQ